MLNHNQVSGVSTVKSRGRKCTGRTTNQQGSTLAAKLRRTLIQTNSSYSIPPYYFGRCSEPHPQIGKCPTSLPQMENTMRRVSTPENSGTVLPRFHRSVLHFPEISRPNTKGPILHSLGILTDQTEGL